MAFDVPWNLLISGFNGEPDPGRVYYLRPISFIHHPSGDDDALFMFDITDTRVCPFLYFRALLAEAVW